MCSARNEKREINYSLTTVSNHAIPSDSKHRLTLLAQQLIEISEKISLSGQTIGELGTDEMVRVWLAKEIRFRQDRNKLFREGLFAEPAWDIMLDLTLARLEKRRISVSSL